MQDSKLTELVNSIPQGWNTGIPNDLAAEIKSRISEVAIPLEQPKISGIYFLVRNYEVVYVGQSKSVYDRLGTHLAERTKAFDSYVIVPVDPAERVMRERQMIQSLKPYYNVMSYREQGFMFPEELSEDLGMSEGQIKDFIRDNSVPHAHGGRRMVHPDALIAVLRERGTSAWFRRRKLPERPPKLF